MTTVIDVTDHPKDQPVLLPKRGPIDLRYVDQIGQRHQPGRGRISVGLAEFELRMAGYTVAKQGEKP